MRRRSVAAWAAVLGFRFPAPKGLHARSSPRDLSTSMRSQIVDLGVTPRPTIIAAAIGRNVLDALKLRLNAVSSISAHLVATISDAGPRRSFTPAPGFDYSF